MELVINEQSYYVPTRWAEVRLGRYMDFMALWSEELDDLQKKLVTLSTLTGAPIDALNRAKKSVIDAALEELEKILSTPPSQQLNLLIEIDGEEYGFHPNLHELKLKEFVDLDTKLGKGWEAMDEVVAILYRPVTERKKDKYKIEEYDYVEAHKRAKLFRDNLSVETVNGAAAFFLTIAMDYMTTTAHSLKSQKQKPSKALRQTKKPLTKNTAGMD